MQSRRTPRLALDTHGPKSEAPASGALDKPNRIYIRIVAVIVVVALFVLSAIAMLEVEPIATRPPLDARTDLNTDFLGF